jgi:uncharacterized protein (TIGR03435 family)
MCCLYRCAVFVLAVTICDQPLKAQGPTGGLTFDVVSIKPNVSGGQVKITIPPRGVVRASNVSLQILVERAYDLRPHQLDGISTWMMRDRFDVLATPPKDSKPAEILEMMKSMLAERFGLRVRREIADRQIYALVLSNEKRQLGPALHRSRYDCADMVSKGIEPDAKDAPLDEKGRFVCLARMLRGPMVIMSLGGVSMADVASRLALFVGREVVNQTELPGTFDLDLHFADPARNAADPADLSTAPNVFAALEEQLGLKLKSTNGPSNRLVIETANHPTPD